MILQNINLINYRNYKELKISFFKGINYFYGNNGAGKTNLVEAINFLSLCRSFKTNDLTTLIKTNETYAYIASNIENDFKKDFIEIYLDKDGKKINIDKQHINKVSELSNFINTIVFTPKDVNLLKDSPSERRLFLNLTISKLSKEYQISLLNYNKILKSRNDLLKKDQIDHDLLNILTNQLIKYSQIIYSYRKKYIEDINTLISKIFAKIDNRNFSIKVIYKSFISNPDFKTIARLKYKESLDLDILKKTTTIGVHKEDFIILLNNKNVGLYGSQGENRMTVLSLKLSSYYLKSEFNLKPIVILDDVLSELDENHKYLLIEFLKNFDQVFITGTSDKERIMHKYYVSNNNIELMEE